MSLSIGTTPPLTEIVATDGEDGAERKSHIEVCVRIRPLKVGAASSTSFLTEKYGSHVNKYKRATGLGRFPRPNGSNKLHSPRRNIIPGSRSNPSSPQSPGEKNDEAGATYAWNVASQDTAVLNNNSLPGRTSSYTLDHVYGPDASTKDLYDKSVLDLVHAAMDGYHASVLAYGQTSTGKTHTMTGTAKQPGLIPLAIEECFDYLSRSTAPREYLLRLSYIEIYKEHIRDLLNPQQIPIRLFETATDGLVIKGLKEEVVTCSDDVLKLLAQGESRRQVGATQMNAHSSRSHTIVRLWIESKAAPERNSQPSTPRFNSASSTTSSLASSSRLGGNVRVSSLSLVDLAGSESVKLTGSSDRRQEGHYINQSLMTLGKIVYALSEMADEANTPRSPTKRLSKQHIPYRDSKLTRLLQPSLSGNAQVVLVCCISPLEQHLEESHNTFKFAMRAKKIPQKATIQEAAPDDEQSLLQSYRNEIEDLRRQLMEAQTTKKGSAAPTSLPTMNEDVSEDEIKELVTSIQTMEKLILKSKPVSPTQPVKHKSAEELLDSMEDDWDDGEDEEDLIALATTKSEASKQSSVDAPQTPVRGGAVSDEDNDRNLEIELGRIQGLLGSVLKKRKQRQTNGSSLISSGASDKEVLELRAQLEKQQAASTIRKADSSFLQKQLEEKEDLLMEVSKLLESLETRQVQLEKENAELKEQVAAYKRREELAKQNDELLLLDDTEASLDDLLNDLE